MVSWISRGIKLWNRHIRSGKKMKLTAAAKPRAVSFIFFPDRIWLFHNFMPVSSHETISQFNFLMPKNLEKHRHFCVSFAWNWSKIKIKNKGGFPLKPHFLHKTDHKISWLLLIMDANLSCLVNIIDAIHNWNSSNHIYWYFTIRYMYSLNIHGPGFSTQITTATLTLIQSWSLLIIFEKL